MILDTGWDELFWLVRVEAAMIVHRRIYPGDGLWRHWVRRQSLSPAWFERLTGCAANILDGQAKTFADHVRFPEPLKPRSVEGER